MLIKVREESMTPTLADGQWVLVLRGARLVRPGDIAVFISPIDSILAVKRCILTDDVPAIVNHGWLITPWGRWFLTNSQWNRLDDPENPPANSYFMVGDNQFRSLDSRYYGYVPRELLVGRVLLPSERRKHG